jgi:hypothetical protein
MRTTQPTYTGITARHCVGVPGNADPPCPPRQGPIGTLPRYDEVGLVSDGDPALAFGPRPGPSGFSWANGSRLYVANLASNVSASFGEPGFKGVEAIAVSRTDNPQAAAAGDESAWRRPVVVSKQSSETFADKEQIWADNAASSRFLGSVYVCYASFRGGGAAPAVVARSTDGGDTWSTRQISPASNVSPKNWGRSGCTVRTDSTGIVYVFFELFQSPARFLPPIGTHFMVRSLDGGRTFERPEAIFRVTDPCFFIDPVIGRCVEDGVAGARSDLAAAPSVDIANGAPTGADASNLIVDAWADGRDGLNSERVMFSWSARSSGDVVGAAAHPGQWRPRLLRGARALTGRQRRIRGLQRVHDALPVDDGDPPIAGRRRQACGLRHDRRARRVHDAAPRRGRRPEGLQPERPAGRGSRSRPSRRRLAAGARHAARTVMRCTQASRRSGSRSRRRCRGGWCGATCHRARSIGRGLRRLLGVCWLRASVRRHDR